MKIIMIVITVLILLAQPIFAQDEEAELAKATQNPLAAMYSLPFQNNTTYGNEPYNRSQNVLNIQPVIPIGLGDKINLINRIILPVITQPSSYAKNKCYSADRHSR